MQCHKCPHYGKGDERCLSCKSAEYLDNRFQTLVHSDNLEELIAKYGTTIPPGSEPTGSDCDEIKQDALRMVRVLEKCNRKAYPYLLRLFLVFSALTEAQIPIAIGLLGGATLTSYAKGAGLSRQAVHQCWARAVKESPELGALSRKNRKRGAK